MAFNLDDYEPVADRIERFWTDHKAGRVLTELVHWDEKRFIVKASIYRDEVGDADATGYAEEIIGSTNVNRTSALENCETSAIGRALANLGYAVKNRASREEMQKAQPAPRPRSGGRVSPSKPQSPESPEDAPRTNGGVTLEEYTKEMVGSFVRWTTEERADSFKRHSKATLGGKPTGLDEVRTVIGAMTEEYAARFPETVPA